MQKMISEVLDEVGKAKTKKEKIAVLRANWSKPLSIIIRGGMDRKIKWLLPEGVPPFNPDKCPDGLGINTIANQIRKFYLFCEAGLPRCKNLTQAKREMAFIEMLESIPEREAAVLIAMKDKRLPNITRPLIDEAFPNLVPKHKDLTKRGRPKDSLKIDNILQEARDKGEG